MIIKELNLISFGKFESESFSLEDGLNIIYGENESGKTTLHNFIYGMFYGFLRPYVKRRLYLPEYEKYRPWNRKEYAGILTFIKDDRVYRIERNFDKGEVRVYDDITGDDITKYIDMGERVKVHLPGIYFFDFNSIVYNNTISICQLGNRIHQDLSTEVKDRLANISTSFEEDISVKKAIADLEKELEDIGSVRAPTRPYGKTMIELDRLRERQRKAVEKQEEYNRYLKEFNDLKEEIKREKSKVDELQKELRKAQIIEKKKIYDEAIKLKEEIESIDNKIQSLKSYSNLSFNDYTRALKLENQYENLNRQIGELRLNIGKAKDKLASLKLEEEGIVDGIKVDDLYRDMDSYSELEDEKNRLILDSKENRLEILNSELKAILDREKRLKSIGRINILLILISLILFFISPPLILLASIPLGIFIYTKKIIATMDEEKYNLNVEIQNIRKEEEERKDRISHIEREEEEILLKYNCGSRAVFNRLYDELRIKVMDLSKRQSEYKETKEYMNKIIEDLQVKEKEIVAIKEELDYIIEKNNSSNMEEFKKGLDKKRDYDNLIKDKERKAEILDRILVDTSLEELRIELNNYDEEYLQMENPTDVSEIMKRIKDKEEDISNMRERYARLGERIDSLNEEIGRLVDIEEEIGRLEKRIEEFDNRIKSINMAKEIIQSISQEIHNQFAPTINKKVGQIISLITDGKYNQVRINDHLDITVENPSTKEIIHIDNLSGGTIDQLYFALRFSIISSLKGERLPLILDDCFIQYDNERLANAMKFLSHISKDKQVILFTCHHREREILEGLGVKYNLINLS